MYIHPINSWTDEPEIIEFMRKNAFATLVSQVKGRSWATHIPFVLGQDQKGNPTLSGHIAKANPQWKSIADQEEVLVIFQGPHAYISSSWYDHENVPTWNYLAVHVYGRVRIIEGDELMVHLKALLDVYESGRPNRVRVEDMSEQFLQSHIRALVGIEVAIEEVMASAKLSQNRDDANYRNIVAKLDESSFPRDREIADEMQRRRPK